MTSEQVAPALLQALEDSQLEHLRELSHEERYAVRSHMRDMYDALERLFANHGDTEHRALAIAVSRLLEQER